MLDINFIRENKEIVQRAIKDKRVNFDLDAFLLIEQTRRDLLKRIEDLRCQKNNNTDKIELNPKASQDLIATNKELKITLVALEDEFRVIDAQYQALVLLVPNIPSDDSPRGDSDKENSEVCRKGVIPSFDFPLKNHIELGSNLNILDLEAGVNISGYRGYCLKNEAVLMHLGLIMHSINNAVQAGFELVLPPTLVKEFALVGSGHFPSAKDETYEIVNQDSSKDKLFLTGTSESSLLAQNRDKIFEEKDLPIKLCGFSQCYRSEIGSYGKDTKGIYRIHEFMKVELVVLCASVPEESAKWLEDLRTMSEGVLNDLELPYRVMQVCTGDMGLGKYKMYDIETWMPSRNNYGETHSDSNLTDWQARRLNIRYKDKNGDIKFVHTLNNTAIASPRILIAILENNQRSDGSVKVPKILQPYVGKDVIKPVAI
jgi:seryl-tRNA synthetase